MKFYYNFNHINMPLHIFYIFSDEDVFEAFKRVFPDYENRFLEIESDVLCNVRFMNVLSVCIILFNLGHNIDNATNTNSFMYYTHNTNYNIKHIVKDYVVVVV